MSAPLPDGTLHLLVADELPSINFLQEQPRVRKCIQCDLLSLADEHAPGTGSPQGTGDAYLDDLLHRAEAALRRYVQAGAPGDGGCPICAGGAR